ncbi:flagellar hook assembly protein FlgD [Chitinibacteraceae bacterium HSL-7]
MAIDLIGGSTAATGALNANAASSLGQEDFLKILMTQLTYQDPLKPMDNQQFIAQMAQFTTLEQTRQLNEKMDAFLSSQSVLQSFGLIGKTVEFSSNGVPSSGKVASIRFEGGQPMLTVVQGSGGELTLQVKLSSIISVRG